MPRNHDSDRADEQRIEREIRSQRHTSLADAIAGSDGGSHLRGASPTPVLKRALLELDQWLENHLHDPDGVLHAVLIRRLTGRPDLLEPRLGDPAAMIAAWLPDLLASPSALAELVREVDMDWGVRNQERPRFERNGQEPADDDPYTIADVTRRLTDTARRAGAAIP